MNPRLRPGQRWVRVVVAAVLLAAGGITAKPAVVRAESLATLNCSLALASGHVSVRPPATSERNFAYRIWYKFDGNISGTGLDWTLHPTWYYGDAVDSYFWHVPEGSDTGQWLRFSQSDHIFYGNWTNGTVEVWQASYFFATQDYNGTSLGTCQTYTPTVFFPFPGL